MSYKNRPKADLNAIKTNISKLLENQKAMNRYNGRYEIDTADTEPSLIGNNTQTDILSGPHNGKSYKFMYLLSLFLFTSTNNLSSGLIATDNNLFLCIEYLDLQRTPGMGRKVARGKHSSLTKSICLKKDNSLSALKPDSILPPVKR